MSSDELPAVFRCAVVSVVKHAYVPNGVVKHPRFDLVVVCDDKDQPDWVHERNQLYADEQGIPYVRDIQRAIAEHDVQVAVISSEAERHCELSVRCAEAGLHVVQDKPMSNRVSECDRVVEPDFRVRPGGRGRGRTRCAVHDVEPELPARAG